MSDTAIRVENLGKIYRIGELASYQTLRESITNILSFPLRPFRSTIRNPGAEPRNPSSRYIWALKDVSFEVKQGEVVGIIGRNGSGKSTLLKVLTRITEPTEGCAEIRGRVGSLLEVGTGFHPELTGRENVYFNGAVLGMKKEEIARKFAEIVEFSGVEKFIDTPLKRYSSGMQVRLAFAVAAHLEPEILLIDEVLAVGDAGFQKKSLGKMGEIARGGRTVLFVSHNMSAISTLCNRAILLREGNIAAQGVTSEVIGQYLSSGENQSGEVVWPFKEAPGSELVRLNAVRVVDEERKTSFDVDIGRPIYLEMEFWCLQKTRMTPVFHLYSQLGVLLFFTTNLHDRVWAGMEYEPGLYRCSCQIPGNFLNDGTHFVNAYLCHDIRREPDIREEPAISFCAHDLGTGQDSNTVRQWLGAIRPLLSWHGSRIGDLSQNGIGRRG
ncbi:MAG: ABC transporter ATP-binding protein [Chloroflexi bacterium]|nr:ABC transporter ATP-binding protein [Chloroflexota bacterium]